MQTIPEQISSMTRAPIEAQLELFGSLAMASVENAGRLAQFQIDATRAAVDQASAVWRQLLTAGPQNMFAAMSQAQSHMARATPTAANEAPVGDQQHTAEDAPSPSDDDHPATAPNVSTAEAAPVAADPHVPQPVAQRTPLAEAAAQVVADGTSAIPIASAPVPDEGPASLPKVTPLEAAPPPAHSHGVRQRKGLPRK